jgi:hypothetical protein
MKAQNTKGLTGEKNHIKELAYIEFMLVPTHVTPCQLSPQGSPALDVHPGKSGDPRAA